MSATKTMKTVLLIVGMQGNRCRETIADTLKAVPGVTDVGVNLFRACATVEYQAPCTRADLIRAVVDAGYGATLERESGWPQIRLKATQGR